MKFAEQLKYSAFKKYSIAHFIHQEVSLLMRKYFSDAYLHLARYQQEGNTTFPSWTYTPYAEQYRKQYSEFTEK